MPSDFPMDNPWADKVLLKEWAVLLQSRNKKQRSFVLKEKDERVAAAIDTAFTRKFDDPKHLHLELFPQPFIGNPIEARFWILVDNPSYSPVDAYDMLGTSIEEVLNVARKDEAFASLKGMIFIKKIMRLKLAKRHF